MKPLVVQGVSKQYGNQFALDNVDITIESGEVFGLVGVNGAGKTTLIKSVLNLIRHDSGDISLFGNPASHASSRRRLQYLPEKFTPYPSLTGYEFLWLSLHAYGMKLQKDTARALAEKLALDPDALARSVRGYSKGMGQKLGLLSVLLCERDLLMLDEPMSGLDPLVRMRLREVLKAYAAEKTGRTIFFSSHILSDVAALCDRIAVIHAGTIRYVGSASALVKTHKSSDLESAFLAEIAA